MHSTVRFAMYSMIEKVYSTCHNTMGMPGNLAVMNQRHTVIGSPGQGKICDVINNIYSICTCRVLGTLLTCTDTMFSTELFPKFHSN
jgi:hypothetical protein